MQGKMVGVMCAVTAQWAGFLAPGRVAGERPDDWATAVICASEFVIYSSEASLDCFRAGSEQLRERIE